LAASLDLLLTGATRPFVSRMTPDRTWARFGAHLAIHPGTVVNRGADLVRELGTIVAGKSDQAPTDPIRTADPDRSLDSVVDGAAGDQQVLHPGHRAWT
jgi:hypothetical protein